MNLYSFVPRTLAIALGLTDGGLRWSCRGSSQVLISFARARWNGHFAGGGALRGGGGRPRWRQIDAAVAAARVNSVPAGVGPQPAPASFAARAAAGRRAGLAPGDRAALQGLVRCWAPKFRRNYSKSLIPGGATPFSTSVSDVGSPLFSLPSEHRGSRCLSGQQRRGRTPASRASERGASPGVLMMLQSPPPLAAGCRVPLQNSCNEHRTEGGLP